eukprot:jgi/Ulvmu1/11700/UM008_0111.1
MAKVYGIALLVVVAVFTLYPFVFLGQQDQLKLKKWFIDLGPILKCILYACARISSYPHIVDMQHAISISVNTLEAYLLVTLGETVGAILQGALFDTVLAPLAEVRGSKGSPTVTSTLRRNPVLMAAIAHISFAQILTPYIVAFVVYCIVDREDLTAVMLGSAMAEALMFIPVQITTGTLWPYNFTYEVALPALRTCATMLLLYRLWCEHRAVSNGEGMPPKTTEYNRISLSLEKVLPRAAVEEEEPAVTRSKSRQRSRSRGRPADRPAATQPPVATPSRLLRFQEGPPKILAKAANMLTPPMLRRKSSQAEAQTAPVRGRTPSAGRRRKSAAAASPVRAPRAVSAEGRSTRRAAAEPLAAAGSSRDSRRRPKIVGAATVQHRLETTLTENVYRTPRRSARLSTRDPTE